MNISDIAAIYNKLCNGNYPSHRKSKFDSMGWLPHKAFTNQLKKVFSDTNNIRITDLGCGTGDDLVYFKSNLPDKEVILDGCDLSNAMIAYANNKNHLHDVVVEDMDNYLKTKVDGSCDAIWSNMSILHTPLLKTEALIWLMSNKLRNNGLLCIGTKISTEDKEIIDPADETINLDRLTTMLTSDTLQSMIMKAGLNIIWSLEFHTNNSSYNYGWVIATK